MRCFFTRSRKRFSMTSKSAMRLTRTSAEAVASSGMTLRVWPPLASVQLNLMRLPAADRSVVCRIWCASSTIAFLPSSGFHARVRGLAAHRQRRLADAARRQRDLACLRRQARLAGEDEVVLGAGALDEGARPGRADLLVAVDHHG